MAGENILDQVKSLLEPLLTEDVFLVDMKLKPTNNFKIFLDADSGMSIEKCIQINRALYKTIEAEGWFPNGDFSLEVSSPGLDEPLKQIRQYHKNIGRKVEVALMDERKIEGKLTSVAESGIELEFTEGKGKKAVVKTEAIGFEQIKQTRVLIQF